MPPPEWPSASDAQIVRDAGKLRLRCATVGLEVEVGGLPNWFDALERLTASCTCGRTVHRLSEADRRSPTDVPR